MFHFIKCATDVARLKFNSTAAVDDDVRVQAELAAIRHARRVRSPDDRTYTVLRSLLVSG